MGWWPVQSPDHCVSERRWPSEIGVEYIWKRVQCLTAQCSTGSLSVHFSCMSSKYICYVMPSLAGLCQYPVLQKKLWATVPATVQPGRTQSSKCGAVMWTAVQGVGSEFFCLSRADLVPVYSFGENEVYKQVIFEEGSWGRWVQKKFQKHIGFAPCIFHGRGLFSSNTWGLLPYSKPITTVGKVLV